MIIDCCYCRARVDAEVIAQHDDPPDQEGNGYRVSLLICRVCKNSLLAGQNFWAEYTEPEQWDFPTRVWPPQEKLFSSSFLIFFIPPIVRSSLEEAAKCLKARAYDACAVMCGRAIEGICKYYDTQSEYLAGGLKELSERRIIDTRLLSWSEALRQSRNLGAHASEGTVTQADARDLLEFAEAICQYVFVLSHKFEQFEKRQAERRGKK